jgi:hypothetical protein
VADGNVCISVCAWTSGTGIFKTTMLTWNIMLSCRHQQHQCPLCSRRKQQRAYAMSIPALARLLISSQDQQSHSSSSESLHLHLLLPEHFPQCLLHRVSWHSLPCSFVRYSHAATFIWTELIDRQLRLPLFHPHSR